MTVNENLKRLVDLAAPYWAGEAEVVWTYFHSPQRTKETDLLWLRRQCFKEIPSVFQRNLGVRGRGQEKGTLSGAGGVSQRCLPQDRPRGGPA